MVLKGVNEGAKLRLITARQWYQELHTGECCVLNHCYVPKKEDESEETTTELLQVLVQFEGVFEKPKELPPQRVVDHKIPLQPGSAPVNLRPSRHSHEQKEEIEKQVREMLQATIIQPSNSSFVSPVLLVKKKDGS